MLRSTQLEHWPSEGSIVFESFVMSYRPGLPKVLRGINLAIRAQEKVGICGRTGAGKSSLIVALLRICEGSSGRVVIDGEDIRTVPLNLLRKRITLIPQDPFLFSNTIRENLDPFEEHTDLEVSVGAVEQLGVWLTFRCSVVLRCVAFVCAFVHLGRGAFVCLCVCAFLHLCIFVFVHLCI